LRALLVGTLALLAGLAIGFLAGGIAGAALAYLALTGVYDVNWDDPLIDAASPGEEFQDAAPTLIFPDTGSYAVYEARGEAPFDEVTVFQFTLTVDARNYEAALLSIDMGGGVTHSFKVDLSDRDAAIRDLVAGLTGGSMASVSGVTSMEAGPLGQRTALIVEADNGFTVYLDEDTLWPLALEATNGEVRLEAVIVEAHLQTP